MDGRVEKGGWEVDCSEAEAEAESNLEAVY